MPAFNFCLGIRFLFCFVCVWLRHHGSALALILFATVLVACTGGGGGPVTSDFTSPFSAPPGDTLPDDTLPDDTLPNDTPQDDAPQDDEPLTKPDDDSSKIDQAPDLFSVDGVEGENWHFLGTPTPDVYTEPSRYNTTEFHYGGYFGTGASPLAVSRFDHAYARGWTGAGSIITIADTGVDPDHPDLAENILYMQDFSGSGIEDRNGHGTHVAGIAAAIRNDLGAHGAAFDSKLAIGKVTDNSAYSFDVARDVAAWGRDLGSVAINVSAAYLRNIWLEEQLVEITSGDSYLDHADYGVNGYYGSRYEALAWREVLGEEQVLVKAAGNDGTPYSAGMNQLATASYDDGTLILDGQMLIVGNWFADADMLIGNKAGNVCVTWQNGACLDGAKIKDFFIMAPGTLVTSTYRDVDYATLTGTSMAAPVVSGAIAILHQMWPHMTGHNLVRLVLQTADKGFSGYLDYIHGQGLLDMERATQPVGATGLPLDGRTTGSIHKLAGAAALSTVPASLRVALSKIMVLDSFERDFKVDLGNVLAPIDTRRGSLSAAAAPYNGFAPYLDGDQHLVYRHYLSQELRVLTGGGMAEGQFLGNSLSGSFGNVRSSSTGYGIIQYEGKGEIAGLHPTAQFGAGVTIIDLGNEPSLLEKVDPVISSSWAIGIRTGVAHGGEVRFGISQPVHIDSAKFTYRIPAGRTLEGGVTYANHVVDLGATERELDYGLSYRLGDSQDMLEMVAYSELRTQVAGLKMGTEQRFGFRFKLRL